MAFDRICRSADRDIRSLCLGKCGACHVERERSPEWHLIAFVVVLIAPKLFGMTGAIFENVGPFQRREVCDCFGACCAVLLVVRLGAFECLWELVSSLGGGFLVMVGIGMVFKAVFRRGLNEPESSKTAP